MRRATIAALLFSSFLVLPSAATPDPAVNENLVMGSPTDAKPDATNSSEDFLIARPQFAMSYNNTK
jgi:hypothetical protein